MEGKGNGKQRGQNGERREGRGKEVFPTTFKTKVTPLINHHTRPQYVQ
jgi:hypothetical protein